jgi:hypothetical protein
VFCGIPSDWNEKIGGTQRERPSRTQKDVVRAPQTMKKSHAVWHEKNF